MGGGNVFSPTDVYRYRRWDPVRYRYRYFLVKLETDVSLISLKIFVQRTICNRCGSLSVDIGAEFITLN